MENICKMEMASAIFEKDCIKVEKTFFGLKTRVTYVPTNSLVVGDCLEYDVKNGEEVKLLFTATRKDFDEIIRQKGLPKTSPNGHVRLVLCYSMDHCFAAMQIFQYDNFEYHVVGVPRFAEGDHARLLLRPFVG